MQNEMRGYTARWMASKTGCVHCGHPCGKGNAHAKGNCPPPKGGRIEEIVDKETGATSFRRVRGDKFTRRRHARRMRKSTQSDIKVTRGVAVYLTNSRKNKNKKKGSK